MPFRFILGRAGSGKTTLCMREIQEELGQAPAGPPLILLVPEQATYQMERALLGRRQSEGFLRVFPLSFRRLAHRIFNEIGGSPLPVLSDLGKQMFLAAVVRKVTPQLEILSRSADRPGLLESLARSLSEFKRYGKTPEDVRRQYDTLTKTGLAEFPLALKLHDLAVIYEAFEEEISGRFVDGDGSLSLLARRLGKSHWIDGGKIWVDGFSGFTPQEYDVLAALIRRAEDVSVSLCLDPGHVPETMADLNALSPFYPTEESYLQILARLPEGVKRRPAVRLGSGGTPAPRFGDSQALLHLERALFARRGQGFEREPEEIRLVEAPDRRSEVRAVARDIFRLVRDEGYRYRDIAVVVRDLNLYSDLVRPVFSEYGIPCFLDESHGMAHHPLVELIRSAVRAVATGWPTEAVLQYLKTDLVPGERGELDKIENYVLAFGVRGKEWISEEPWSKRILSLEDEDRPRPEEEDILVRLDTSRRKALEALQGFDQDVSCGMKRVREITAALCRMLERLNVPVTLRLWADEARREGATEAAREHGDAWKSVTSLLGSLVDALGDEKFSLREYQKILEAGLSQLTLGLIPPSLDQVTVGSVERSRHPELRAAFVLGVAEGAFPRARAEDPIFNDQEREDLLERGFELASSARRELHRERYFAYIAFTRAQQKLWISYPRAADDGRELLPSVFVRRLQDVFPQLQTIRMEKDEPVSRPADVFRLADFGTLVSGGARLPMTEVKDTWWAGVYDQIVMNKETRPPLERALRSLTYSNEAHLTRNLAMDLYGTPLRVGVVSLENFSACPFRYFATHGLTLRDRPTFELQPLDLGSLYHAVLRAFFERTRSEGLRWSQMDDEQAVSIVDQELDRIVPRLKAEILQSSARNRMLLADARRSLAEFVRGLLFHFRRSDFEPVAAEVGFDGLGIDLDGGLRLEIRGRIDRIDAVAGSSPRAVRVVDYKTGGRKLDLWKLEEGLALQLTTYLLAVVERSRELLDEETPVPAGGFFTPILRKFERRASVSEEKEDTDVLKKAYRIRGVFGEEFAQALDRELEEGQASPTLAMYLRKGGTLGKPDSTDFVPAGCMRHLIELTRERLRRIGNRILKGEAVVHPFRAGGVSACQYCELLAVCRFEPWRNKYRNLEPRKRTEVIEDLRKGERANGWKGENP